jgi:hypothetical protein
MNSTAGQSTHFLDTTFERPTPEDPNFEDPTFGDPNFEDPTFGDPLPIVFGPTLYEWCVLVRGGAKDRHESPDCDTLELRAIQTFRDHPSELTDYDEPIRCEIRSIGLGDYPSRALYGHYLNWCFDRAAASLPSGATLRVHRDRVVDCLPHEDGSQELLLESGETLLADAVAFALGWLQGPDSPADSALKSRKHESAIWIRPENPIDQQLDMIPAQTHAIVRGFGMGFFDTMTLLTVGRGGRFVPDDRVAPDNRAVDHDRLRYVRSGEEPVVHVGSRRGVPFRSKSQGTDSPEAGHRFLRRLNRANPSGGWSLSNDLLPLILKDAAWDYYSTLALARPTAFSGSLSDLLAAIEGLTVDSEEFESLARRVVPGEADRLNLHALERPADRSFRSAADYTEWLRAYVADDVAESKLGRFSAVKAATRSLGSARKAMSAVVQFGGLVASDYQGPYSRFLSFGAMIAGGPPVSRLNELIALMDAGIVRPIGPNISVTATDDGFAASSPDVPGSNVVASVLLDAWMHSPNATATADTLLGNLRERGLSVPHAVLDRAAAPSTSRPITVPTGAVDIDEAHSRLVRADGQPDESLFAIGIPTEGARIFTIVSPTPQTASDVLRETNNVSKQLLLRAQKLSSARMSAAEPAL